ncbi:P-loop containing nucleoside triphosphate hydrolase protein [Coprinopsis sp. MPI-PUGE-AT-0042]|nr:P-loop containing nucleoside triphosphate hydrolase protein [Coprinopsis sp. MPI-PUGE-AT-0042]
MGPSAALCSPPIGIYILSSSTSGCKPATENSYSSRRRLLVRGKEAPGVTSRGNASRHARFLSLHFTLSKGRIAGANFITFDLDEASRGRTNLPHLFRFLDSATAEERDYLGLEDTSDYKLLSSSGFYELSSAAGVFLSPDDSIEMVKTHASLAALGSKPKHLSSIFTLPTSILLLGHLEFAYQDEGVAQRVLASFWTMSRVLCMRDRGMRDLYPVFFAYIIESCNHRFSASLPQPTYPSSTTAMLDVLLQTIPISILGRPGYQARTSNRTTMGTAPFVGSPCSSNSNEEFTTNFANEHSFEPSVAFNFVLMNENVSEVLWAFRNVVNAPNVHLAAGGASLFEAPVLPEVGSKLDSPGSINKSAGNRLFMITHIRPNDSLLPNSFDKRRVRLQPAAFAVHSLVQRFYRLAIDRSVFGERCTGEGGGAGVGRKTAYLAKKRVEEGGHVCLTYDTWKSVEDRVRAAEKDGKGGPARYGGYKGDEDEMGTEYTHGGVADGQMPLGVPAGYAGGFGAVTTTFAARVVPG